MTFTARQISPDDGPKLPCPNCKGTETLEDLEERVAKLELRKLRGSSGHVQYRQKGSVTSQGVSVTPTSPVVGGGINNLRVKAGSGLQGLQGGPGLSRSMVQSMVQSAIPYGDVDIPSKEYIDKHTFRLLAETCSNCGTMWRRDAKTVANNERGNINELEDQVMDAVERLGNLENRQMTVDANERKRLDGLLNSSG